LCFTLTFILPVEHIACIAAAVDYGHRIVEISIEDESLQLRVAETTSGCFTDGMQEGVFSAVVQQQVQRRKVLHSDIS